MTTSAKTLLKSVASLEDRPIDPALLGYFQAASQDEAHELIVRLFKTLARDKNITRAMVARRLNKSPEQVTRWLSAPGNWTLETLTNLALAMGHKPTFGTEAIADVRQGNDHHPAVSQPGSFDAATQTRAQADGSGPTKAAKFVEAI